MRGLERRVEECVAIAGASVSSVQSRCAGLEEVIICARTTICLYPLNTEHVHADDADH
jgi:hypothetical protein